MDRNQYSLASVFELTLALSAYVAGMTQILVATPQEPYWKGGTTMLVTWLVLCVVYLRRRCFAALLLLYAATGIAGLAAIEALRGPSAGLAPVKLAAAVPPACLVGMFLSFPAHIADWLQGLHPAESRLAREARADTDPGTQQEQQTTRRTALPKVLEILAATSAFICAVVTGHLDSSVPSGGARLAVLVASWTVLGVVYFRRRWWVIFALHSLVALVATVTATGPWRSSVSGYAENPVQWAANAIERAAVGGSLAGFSAVIAWQLVVRFRELPGGRKTQ